MNPLATLNSLLGRHAGMATLRQVAAPLVILLLAMMMLPLPAFALDVLHTFNIAIALMLMLVAAQMVRPLDFAAFRPCC